MFSARIRDACKDGRPEEIQTSHCPVVSADENEEHLERKTEELFWVATLLLAAPANLDRNRDSISSWCIFWTPLSSSPRLPSYPENRVEGQVVQSVPSNDVLYPHYPWTSKDWRRTYHDLHQITATLRASRNLTRCLCVGNLNDPDSVNPWPAIIASVIHAPETHIVKVIRALITPLQKIWSYGSWRCSWCSKGTKETHKGLPWWMVRCSLELLELLWTRWVGWLLDRRGRLGSAVRLGGMTPGREMIE